MRLSKTLLGLLALFIAACGKEPVDTPSTAAPVLVSISPADGTADITASELTVTFAYDQNIRCSLSDRQLITVNEDAAVSKVNDNSDKIIVTVTGLTKGKTYTITIPDGIIKGYRQNQPGAACATMSFTTKEAYVEKDYERNPDQSLTNTKATAATKKLYSYLLSQYGENTISGAMGSTAWTTEFTDYIYSFAGEYPAIVGFDYLFLEWPAKKWDGCPDYGDISVIQDCWDNGNIIQVGWHWNVASNEADITDPNKFSFNCSSTTFKPSRALMEDTWERKLIDSQISKLAGYMSLLADADIPVLFRPLHEAAGDYTWGAWFWWGRDGAESCVALWKYLRNKLEKDYKLNNLIWVWTAQTSDEGKLATVDKLIEWYPGDDCVDIVGADLYVTGGSSQSASFKLVNNSVKGRKMVALSECGSLLDPDKYFKEDAPWLYFMSWGDTMPLSNSKNGWNTEETWKKGLAKDKILNRGDLDGIRTE